ncbi:MAG: glycosyltransferase [Candidatus Azambacteria bacterium]|nr:glycosyltransferase [Candidatus Azambacteria bacterium]
MKILIATDTYYPNVNGAAYFAYRLANALAKRGHNVFVTCPSQIFKNTVSNNNGVTVYGIRSVHIPVYQNFRISPLVISTKTIQRLFKEISPDVVHIQNHFMIGKGVAITAKKLGIPVMGTNHFMPENLVHYFHLPKMIENWLKNFGWKQCIKVFEQLDYVTTPTKTAAELLKKAGFGKNITPVSCGIDLEIFSPKNNGLYLKKTYAIPADKPVMLYVGRLDKEKKIEVILRALPDILLKTDVHFVLAGVGKKKQNLETLAEKLGVKKSITFTGFIPDKDFQNIYRIADIFVIASIAELQSIVTMEAMASGLPVVAVNAMALPELVRDGENGYLFPDGDSKILAEKVLAVLLDQNLKEQMSKKSLEIIKAHDLNKTIDKYESLYYEIANR